MAAGFSLNHNTFESFKDFCEDEVYLQSNSTSLNKISYYDEIIDSSIINRDLYDLINVASPYGQGNPEPQFIIKNAKIDYWSEVGKGHLKVKISNANYGNIDAIAFGSKGTPLGDIIMNHSGSLIHFAGVIKKNDWQGNKRQCNKQSAEIPIDTLSEIFCASINCANISHSTLYKTGSP